jgi:hypothetical protein
MQMSTGGGVFLILAGVTILVMAVLQVLQYRRGGLLISSTQLVLRLLVAMIVLATIAGIFVGLLHFNSVDSIRNHELEFVVYWSVLLGAVFTVMVLAIVDYNLVQRAKHRAQADVYRQMSELQEIIARAQERKSAETTPPVPADDDGPGAEGGAA